MDMSESPNLADRTEVTMELLMLPIEILEIIVSFMDAVDLHHVTAVNSTFRALTISEDVWIHLYQRSWPKLYHSLCNSLWVFNNQESKSVAYHFFRCSPSAPSAYTTIQHDQQQQQQPQRGIHRPITSDSAGPTTAEADIEYIKRALADAAVQNQAKLIAPICYAVRRLCYFDADATEEFKIEIHKNREAFGRDTVDLILKMMARYPLEDKLQLHGCCALGNLAIADENKKAISDLGGLLLILKAIRTFQDSADVLDYAFYVLEEVSFGDSSNQEIITNAGGLDLIMKVVQKHPTHVKIQEEACGTLYNLLQFEPNHLKFTKKGYVKVMLQILQQHTGSPSVMKEGLQLLGYVSFFGKVKRSEKIEIATLAMQSLRAHREEMTSRMASAALADVCFNGMCHLRLPTTTATFHRCNTTILPVLAC
eukprot:GEZU01011033.1.p1 GENE.GEZU01011033.1~~GEZU01011033.1.p1  ORF type:complete len:424 (-),score=53.45 GEZU01011033.1:278-1549(-)